MSGKLGNEKHKWNIGYKIGIDGRVKAEVTDWYHERRLKEEDTDGPLNQFSD